MLKQVGLRRTSFVGWDRMAIKTECHECGRVYHVKDELDGKKIRCKECQAVVLVQSESEDDWDESVDEEELQPPIRQSKSKKTKRRSGGISIPTPILIALACVAVMIALTLLEILGISERMGPPGGNGARQGGMQGRLIGTFLRCLVQAAVFVSVYRGRAGVVTPSIVMCSVSILVCSGMVVLLWNIPNIESLWLKLILNVLVRVVYIGSILAPTAKDYLRN